MTNQQLLASPIVHIHFSTGEHETCSPDHAIACLSGHIDPRTDEPAHEKFKRTGRAQCPYAVYELVEAMGEVGS